MKTIVRFLLLLMLISYLGSQTLMAQKKKNFYASWNFEAPTAPHGLDIGVVTISKDGVTTKYPGDPKEYLSSSMKFKGDTLIFVISPTVDVTCKLVLVNKTKLIGTGVWTGGKSVFNLSKIEKQKTKSKKQ
jgi:hypothetical protein